jgi:hypothetical protein
MRSSASLVELGEPAAECEISDLSRSLPRIGAKERKERKTSLNMISGEVSNDDTVRGVGEGVDATVWRMSPIWQVTAVHGKDPMNAPRIQSLIATPQTPQAMLIPDQGTTPMRRNTESRTHADDLGFELEVDGAKSDFESPSRAFLVRSRARGKKWVRNGASGVASIVAHTEPRVVRVVRRMVAYAGENNAPAKTFHITLPGIDQACFQTAVMAITPITWAIGPGPLCE